MRSPCLYPVALGGGSGALQLPCPHVSWSQSSGQRVPWVPGHRFTGAQAGSLPGSPALPIVRSLTDSLRSDSGSGASLLCGLVQVTQLLWASPFFSLQKEQEASYLGFSSLAVAAASLLWCQAAPYFLKDYLTFFFVRKELGILAA